MSLKLTVYQGGPDNAYPGHPDGGNDTCTGVPIDENYATFAIPGGRANAGRTNLKVGDVVLFTHKAPDGKTYTSLGWATDIGGLPHGDIDVVKGALPDALHLTTQVNTKPIHDKYSGQTIAPGQYATDLTGQGDISAERVAHISAKGFRNPNAVNEAIKKINAKLASGELKPEDAQKALTEEVKDPSNVELADEHHPEITKEVHVTARDGGKYGKYGTYDDGRKHRRLSHEDLADEIDETMPKDPMMALLMLFVGLLSGHLNFGDFGKTTQTTQETVKEVEAQAPAVEAARVEADKNKNSPDKATQQSAIPSAAGKQIDELIKNGKIKLTKSNDVSINEIDQSRLNNFLLKCHSGNPDMPQLLINARKSTSTLDNGATTFDVSLDGLSKADREKLSQAIAGSDLKLTIMDLGDKHHQYYSLTSLPANQEKQEAAVRS